MSSPLPFGIQKIVDDDSAPVGARGQSARGIDER